MKKRNFYSILAAVVLLSLTCCGKKKNAEVPPVIEEVSFNDDNLNCYLLEGNSLELSNAYIVISYSDSTTKNEPVTSSMTGTLDYSFGPHEADVVYNLNNENYYFSMEYYVFEDENELSLVKDIHALPFINGLSFDDIPAVVAAINKYKALTDVEKTFLDTYFEYAISRLNQTEKSLISVYQEAKKEELDEFYRTINESSYTASNLEAIQQAIANFSSKNCSSLEEVIAEYENTVAELQAIEKKTLPLDEYKLETIALLETKFNVDFSKVVYKQPGEYVNPAKFEKESKQYLELTEINPLFVEASSKINAATSSEDVDRAYKESYLKIEKAFIPLFINDAVESINDTFTKLRDIEKDLLDSWDDISISVRGLYDNILCDYLDDNRWWMPEPYRPKTILDSAESELQAVTKVDDLITLYNALIYEITRCTLQKNLEMYYSIWRNINPAYDTTDYFYWNIVSDYWGDTPARQFVYTGALSAYKGIIYGNSSSNVFRLASFFFKEEVRMQTSEALLNRYFEFKNFIAPDPLAVSSVEVDLDTLKTEYELGETIDLTGGTATVTYNDTSIAKVNLTNSMIAGTVDTSTTGSKTVTVKFNDPKLNEEQTASFSIVVLSSETKYNNIIVKIANLPQIDKGTEEGIEKVKEILVLYHALTELEKAYFAETFSSEFNKFRAFEEMCSTLYGELELKPIFNQYEKINVCALVPADLTSLRSSFNALLTNVKAHKTFDEIDADIASFGLVLDALTYNDSLDLDEFKEATISSLDELCAYQLNQYGGQKANVTCQMVNHTVKEEEDVAPIYDAICEVINNASSRDDVISTYYQEIDSLYDVVLAAYKAACNVNLRQSMFDLRSTISMIWAQGDNDIVEMNGEGGSKMTTDYLDDSGYYIWYVPLAYRTGNLYNKIGVRQQASSKYEINNSYLESLFDISRSTMYRNIIHTWAFNGLSGPWWSIIFCSPDITYDGSIEEYEGTVYPDSQYRLWGWGYRPNGKATSISQLVEKYNYDLNLFLAH